VIQVLHSRESSKPGDDVFRHIALLYSGERAFVEAAAEFIRDGIAAEEPSLVVVSQRKIDLLREELGPTASRVCFADMNDVGTNPGAIISAWDDFVRDALAEGQRVRGIGEPVHCERSEDEMTECHHHEALLNLAFADAPGFQLMCPYDVDVLPRDAVDSSLMTHPLVQQDGTVRPSAVYRGEEMAQETFEEPLEAPPEGAYEMKFDRDSLGAVRAFVSELATDVGINGDRREDLLLAISELATNSVRHGGGQGELRAWLELDTLVCEVCDRGVIARPLTGRRRPTPGALGGYGLWLVNQVCDLVQVRTRFGRTVVRMRMRRG
jgi:anti-sigma regulatory factor (Ser/Thr protein kinase)